MTRPNFVTNIPGTLKRETNSGTTYLNQFDCKVGSETVSGVSRRKPKGWIPPTGYSFEKRHVERAYGMSKIQNSATTWSNYQGYIGITGGRFNSLNHFDSLMSEGSANSQLNTSAAIVAARQKLKGQSVDLGVAFAERKRTSQMLGDNTKRMANAARELQRGNYRNAARALGIIHDPGKPRGSNWTNHWLQLQYGWKPLLSDVYGACDALSKRPREDWRVSAKARRSDRYEAYHLSVQPTNGNIMTDFWRGSVGRDRGVFVRLDAIPDNDLLMSLTSLGVTNPLKVAWELVPYSFVVDWVLPVGNWLDSLDALLGYTSVYQSVSCWNESKWEGSGLNHTWNANKYYKQDWKESKRVLRVTRAATSGSPIPPLPRIKDPRSLGHMANGLSLLAQAFGRR